MDKRVIADAFGKLCRHVDALQAEREARPCDGFFSWMSTEMVFLLMKIRGELKDPPVENPALASDAVKCVDDLVGIVLEMWGKRDLPVAPETLARWREDSNSLANDLAVDLGVERPPADSEESALPKTA